MDQDARFRIHWVAQQTGVSEATLRAWERRYGVLTPDRTQSGYRVYSAEDVQKVLRMRELCRGGMAPSDAAALLITKTTNANDESESAPPASHAFAIAYTSAQAPLSVAHAVALMEKAALTVLGDRLQCSLTVAGCEHAQVSLALAGSGSVFAHVELAEERAQSVLADVRLARSGRDEAEAWATARLRLAVQQ